MKPLSANTLFQFTDSIVWAVKTLRQPKELQQ